MSVLAKQACFAVFSLVLLFSVAAQAAPPAEGWLVWESNRADARSEVYLARADGTQVTRMTKTGGVRPGWSPDGRWIHYFDDANDVYVVRPDGSDRHVIHNGWVVTWLHDNSGLLVIQGSQGLALDPETKTTKKMFDMAEFPQLAGSDLGYNGMTHDNRYIVFGTHLYINGYTGTNGSFVSEYSAVVVDTLHKDRTYFVGSGCWPFTPPAGDLVFHICGNCPTFPDIYRMSLNDLDTRASYAPEMAHPDEDWGHEYNPRVSNDNKYMVYMASTGCHQGSDCDYDIWLHEIGAGADNRVRIIENPGFDGYPHLHVGPLWQPSAEPRLLVTPSRVTFLATTGVAPAPQTLAIKNDGAGTLGAATATVDPGATWLDVKQEGQTITLSVREGTVITRGNRCTNLTIDVPGAQGSPAVVPVTLFGDETFPGSDVGVSDASVGLLADGGMSLDIDASVESDSPFAPDASGPFDCDALAAPSTPAVDAGATGPFPMGRASTGCGCRLGAVQSSAWSLLALLGLLALRRRRRQGM